MSTLSSRRQFLKNTAAAALASAIPVRLHAGTAPLPAEGSAQDVVFLSPDDAQYPRHRQPFNKRILLQPAVIALCATEKGVQNAIERANELDLPVAVKSGGHSLEGYCVNDGGMVIDLSRMTTLQLGADNRLQLGPGCRLAHLFDYLLPRNRLIPTGSCGGVGVAGLTLGGGYGMFSRAYGMTCDNLRRVRLIDGTGQLLDSQDHPELLWACRGGGNGNFGIVTHFEFDTHPAPKLFHAYRFKYRNLNAQKAAALAQRWFELTPKLPREAFSAFVLGTRTLTILVTSFAPGPERAPMSDILRLLRQDADETPAAQHDSPINSVKRYYGRAEPLYFKNVSAGFYRGYADIENVALDAFEQTMAHPGMLFQINTFDPAEISENADDAGAFPHRTYPYIAELQSYWEKPSQEAANLDAVRKIQHALTKNGISAHYANYPDIDLENWAQAYYGKNYARLQSIKRTYDPDNRLRHPQSVRPPT